MTQTAGPDIKTQADLFGGVHEPAPLEIHEHCYISGPNANWSPTRRITHSHQGGDTPHQHPDTGPASYTIDKDEWMRMTGMVGGGRKRFTKTPEGEQLPRVELEDWQKTFEVHVAPPPPDFKGQGAGLAPAARMILGCRMTVSNVLPFPSAPRKAQP